MNLLVFIDVGLIFFMRALWYFDDLLFFFASELDILLLFVCIFLLNMIIFSTNFNLWLIFGWFYTLDISLADDMNFFSELKFLFIGVGHILSLNVWYWFGALLWASLGLRSLFFFNISHIFLLLNAHISPSVNLHIHKFNLLINEGGLCLFLFMIL